MKKRTHGLPAELLPVEVVIVLRTAVMNSFMNIEHAQKALLYRGWWPFNRATLDDFRILATASDEIQKERTIVLKSRGITKSSALQVPPTQRNLLESGSGQLAGGMSAAGEFVEAVNGLNYSGATASNIMKLMQNTEKRNEGRRQHMGEDAANKNQLSTEELQKRYRETTRFTTGTVFGKGNGILGTEVRDEVIRRNNAKKEHDANEKKNKQSKLRVLQGKVFEIRDQMREKKETAKDLTNRQLQSLIMWKKQKEDKKMPTNKKELLQRWAKVKDRPSPHVSPCNSEAEEMDREGCSMDDCVDNGTESEDEEEEVYHRHGHRRRGLVFDPVESEDEESGIESEEEEWKETND